MDSSKSPGPDGYIAGFFKLHWEKVGQSVCDAVNNFLTTGFLLKEWNHSLLVMIPKCEMPEEVGHLRPISLCNTIYKCASKCLVLRMKLVLPAIISPSQHAFISGRFMTDNVLLSHELIDKINHRKRGKGYLASVKMDMSKAYDRVYWIFLLKVLRAYGFPNHWIHLIHQCISTVSYKVLINGCTSDQFRPKCGIRQGDPLSTFPFLFCMEMFSRMLQMGSDLFSFQGINITRGSPKISHIFFADDALLFFKADRGSCSNITNIVNRFCRISGQQLNLQKSHFKLSPNTPELEQQGFRSILKMQMVQNFRPHLGVPIDLTGKRHTNFQSIVDKVVAKVSSWNSVCLSQTQKLILINSVLVAMASHVLSCMEIPLSISYKIDSILARFFWAKGPNTGMHWVNRKIIQLPKGLGGLGVRNMATLNKALLMRQAWRVIKNPQSLLGKAFFRKFPSSLKGVPSTISGKRFSSGMRGIGRATNLLLQGCDWKIGNGKTVVAGRDRWVKDRVPVFKSSVTLQNARNWKVNHFILPNGPGWNLDRVNSCFEFDDARRIVEMELPAGDSADFLYWRFHKSGKFTVKTAYAMLAMEDYGQNPYHRHQDFFKILWALKILPKWKLFLWKLLHNSIATKVNLGRRGTQLEVTCDYCQNGNEDSQHLFRFCDLARQDGKNSQRTVYFITTMWALWISRNNRVFKSTQAGVSGVLSIITEGLKQQGILCTHTSSLRFLHPPERDPIYPPGFFRKIIADSGMVGSISVIQVDGSWHKNSRIAGMGWYWECDNLTVDGILGGACVGTAESALHTEVVACLMAFRWCVQATLENVTILTDSQRLVEMLQIGASIDVHLLWTVEEILRLGTTFNWCSIQKVDRHQVQKAHELATGVASTSLSFCNFP
ncbi:uncharacterized protein [Spinacia oleracea]|uniref:Reverse transcriptase domain-containing protein n=1 Tax=Spinacia oleracea TaxID=3562 RepID=A0ABM3R7S0_SPIOL|nr:uncharacterized protein LOC130467234 [Spinacia oleracea]